MIIVEICANIGVRLRKPEIRAFFSDTSALLLFTMRQKNKQEWQRITKSCTKKQQSAK
jgi:hypothetical protein